MHERPSWDAYFMQIAHLVKTRATCPRRSVGALIVRDKRILCTGYNGSPQGLPHCPQDGQHRDWPDGCMRAGHCIRSLHAEQNAILQAAKIGVSCETATMYVTCQPCNSCAKMIINAGIVRVIYEGDYPDDFSIELFREASVELLRYRDGTLEVLELGS
jgi:dCMP deaminase